MNGIEFAQTLFSEENINNIKQKAQEEKREAVVKCENCKVYDEGYQSGYVNASRNIFENLQTLINLAELDSMMLNGNELIHGIRFAAKCIEEVKEQE